MSQELEKINSELTVTEKLSSLDSVLLRRMDEVSQIYKTEMLPGEIRVWQKTLDGELPQTVDWAFGQYFKIGKFPPKPVDIFTLVLERRESAPYPDYQPMTDEEYEQAKKDRASYFTSAEYKNWLQKMKTKHGI